ncbi:MAG: ThuA domain-containing protein [Muribaculaceae bacterium]|nr:ThuA domain-containing protein [Muribaculaceae bacterium]
MKYIKSILLLLTVTFFGSLAAYAQDNYPANYARAPRFKALLFYNKHVEEAHLQFAEQTIDFFKRLTYGDGYILEVTDNFSAYTDRLNDYDVLIAVNDAPVSAKDRAAFEKYMENGGGWIGFHAAAYNDRNTKWPWFNKFLGAGVFYCNNWPPQPALLDIDVTDHAVTKNLPASFVAPASEWYQWDPSPRSNPNVDILLSLSSRNYPIGIKDVVKFGDFPVVWTNRDYRMIYLNMGHGDVEYLDATQNLLFVNAFRWIVSRDPKGNPFEK